MWYTLVKLKIVEQKYHISNPTYSAPCVTADTVAANVIVSWLTLVEVSRQH